MNEYIYTIINKLLSKLDTVYKYKVKLTNERFEIYAAVLFFVETVGTSPHPQGPPLPCQPGPGLVVREDHQLGELLHWSHRGSSSWLPTRRKTRPAPAHCSVFSRSSETKNFNIILQTNDSYTVYSSVYINVYNNNANSFPKRY